MKNDVRAFILLELIVALTILGMGFSVLFASMSGSARNIERLEAFQERQQRIRNLLAELDLVQSLRSGDTASGSFEDGSRWRIEVSPFLQNTQDTRAVLRILLRLEWEGNSGTQTRTIETYRLMRNPANSVRSLDDQLRDLQQ